MINNKILNAGLYIRVSTERQVEEGFSLNAQKENLSSFANLQEWNIFDIYADEGISGKNVKDRPEVKRLINDIKNNKVQVVVLYKFDRLTRDMRDTEDFINLIQEYGIMVYAISGGVVDVSTPSGRFNTRILGAAAQFERENTQERVIEGFRQKVKQGYSLCSATPSYGYDRPKHQEIQSINKEEAKVVKRIFKMYNQGKTFTEIADILNAEGIPTKNRGKIRKRKLNNEIYTINSVWQSKTIRLILSNPTYIGKVRYGVNRNQVASEDASKLENKGKGFIANGKHEPIIDLNTWNKTQERLLRIKKVIRTNHPKDNVYYCGTLICGICGQQLTTQRTIHTKKNGAAIVHYGYRCVNREKGLCSAIGISHKKVEEVFLEYIDRIEELTEVEKVEMIDEIDESLITINDLKSRLSKIKSKRQEVMNLFLNNQIKYDEMRYMTDNLDKKDYIISSELHMLEKEYQPVKQLDKSKIAKSIKEHWKYLDNREKFNFLSLFVENITIVNYDKDKINGRPKIIDVKFYEE